MLSSSQWYSSSPRSTESSSSPGTRQSGGIKESTARIGKREKDARWLGTVQCEAHRMPSRVPEEGVEDILDLH